MTELENQVAGVKNYNIAVKKRGDEITFLRRIIRGGADGSYGVEVAKLAGVPVSVVKRARVILKALEGGSVLARARLRSPMRLNCPRRKKIRFSRFPSLEIQARKSWSS